MKYLKEFIIGSSFPAFIVFFILVDYEKRKNYEYNFYTKITPLILGIFNVVSLWIAEKLNISMKNRFIYMTIIGSLYTITNSRYRNYYNYSNKQWCLYGLMIVCLYSFTFMGVIYNLERLMK